jgi:hypothetical protein
MAKLDQEIIEQELELAKMMVADLNRLYKKYAKAAQAKETERLERIRAEKFKECENEQELQELFGFGELTRDEYYSGLDFFDAKEKRRRQKSLIEQHRINLKEIRDLWKGTINERQDELNEMKER